MTAARATTALALALLLVLPGALAQANNSSDAPNPYLDGTRDAANAFWWYVALAVLVVIVIVVLWVAGVLPR